MTTKQEIALRDKRHLVGDVAVKPSEDAYDYTAALEATGVKVLAFERFGSYQGDWWAHIEFPNHELFFITGSFGSCSGCDAFEAEFGWEDDKAPDYFHRLRNFGLDYLMDCMTGEQAIAQASKNLEWDSDAGSMVAWLQARIAAQGPVS